MSLFRSEQFNVWFPAIVVGFLISLVVAALWDFIRRRFWLFVSRGSPGILKEVGLDSQYQSRAEAEDRHRETIDKLNKIARGMNLPVSPKSPNSGASAAIDIEAHAEINPHHTASGICMAGTSTVEGTYSISASSQNQLYPGEAFEDMDCRPIINLTAYFPDGTSKDVTRPAKKLYKRYANGRVKRMKSSIILQALIAIDPRVLAEIVELAKHCMQKENRCTFQLGNWAILYHDAVEVQMHFLKKGDVPVNVEARWQDGKTGITMRGLYLTGSQVKVGTKRTSKILRSAGPATQKGAGDLDELHVPAREFDVPGEDSLICASKVVVVDEISLIVRSEISSILPPREENALLEAVWTRWLQISNSVKKMLRSLMFGAEHYQPEHAANCSELEFDPQQHELSVEHWKGLSQIELLNMRKEVLLHLQEQRASGITENAGLPSPDSHLIFIRDEHYLECWQKGMRLLNEVIHRNSNDSHSHTHVRVRGGIQFLLGDYESALQDYDLALLNTGGHQCTVLLERALVKCMLGRYSEAMEDVIAVITLNRNVNDVQELQACIQQILDQQRAFQIDTESGSSCQHPLLPDQEKAVVKIPDLLTGDEWLSGEIGSQIPPISDAGTAGEPLDVARAADWSLTSIAEALELQLKLTNDAQSLEMNHRYHVRRISFIVNLLEDGYDPDDVVNSLSLEDQELLNWQAPTEDLQDDLKVRNDLSCLSGRLCPSKNLLLSLCDKVTADDGHEQRRGPHPLSCYRHISYRSAMLTKHSAADGDVQTLFLYDGTAGDRSCWRRRSHEYIKLLVLPEARSTYRAFWVVQWDVVDMQHVLQGDPDWGLCSNPAAVEHEDDLRKLHNVRRFGQVTAAGTRSPTSDGNGLNRHRGSDARTNPRMSILVNEKSQTQPPRIPGVDRLFPTISEDSESGGDLTVDSSSMNACLNVEKQSPCTPRREFSDDTKNATRGRTVQEISTQQTNQQNEQPMLSGGRKMTGGIMRREAYRGHIVNIRAPKWKDNQFWINCEDFEAAQYIADAAYYFTGRPPVHFPDANFDYLPLLLSTGERLTTREKCSAHLAKIAKDPALRDRRKDFKDRAQKLILEMVKTPNVVQFLNTIRASSGQACLPRPEANPEDTDSPFTDGENWTPMEVDTLSEAAMQASASTVTGNRYLYGDLVPIVVGGSFIAEDDGEQNGAPMEVDTLSEEAIQALASTATENLSPVLSRTQLTEGKVRGMRLSVARENEKKSPSTTTRIAHLQQLRPWRSGEFKATLDEWRSDNFH